MLRRALFMPWELEQFLDPAFVEQGCRELNTVAELNRVVEGLRSPAQKVSALELSHYMRSQLLRDSDWAGMAHSLEIRLPLVDVEVLRAVAPLMLRDAANKADLARTPRTPLPWEVVTKKKTGFAIPVERWMGKRPHERALRGLRAWALEINPAVAGA
jgi:asparagine synthase (glutamine-hydrolysing)